jgi:hypothetical protein
MAPTRRSTIARRTALDLDELMELMCGPAPAVGDPEGPPVSEWNSDAERRAAWEAHKNDEPLASAVRPLWAEEVYGP